MTAAAIAINVAIVALMAYTGLLFDPALIRQQINRSGLRALGQLSLANYVFIPLATLVLLWLVPSSPNLNLVLMILALMPCAPLVPALVSMAGEPPEWSLFVFFSFSLLNILMIPVLVMMLPQAWVTGNHAEPGADGSSGFTRYMVSIFVPLLLGVVFRLLAAVRGPIVLRLMWPLMQISMILALLLFVLEHLDEFLSLSMSEIAVFLLFELMCVTIVLIFGPRQSGTPMSSILPSAFRNFAMGLAFASMVFSQNKTATYIIAFGAVMQMISLAMLAVLRLIKLGKIRFSSER